MDLSIAFVLGLTLLALVAFVKEWIPADGIALGVLGALVVAGIVDPREAVGAFGNGAVVTVGASFILAAGLSRSGALDPVGRILVTVAGTSPTRAVVVLMSTAASISAFMNNTPLAVLLMPITLGLARRTGIAASRLLIPMSYGTIVGGMCTLIGTSTNVLVSGDLRRRGIAPIGMFEPLPLGLAGVALTVAYMATIGRRLLPDRTTVSETVRRAGLRDYVTELSLAAHSPLVGRRASEVELATGASVRILRIVRGEEGLDPADPRASPSNTRRARRSPPTSVRAARPRRGPRRSPSWSCARAPPRSDSGSRICACTRRRARSSWASSATTSTSASA